MQTLDYNQLLPLSNSASITKTDPKGTVNKYSQHYTASKSASRASKLCHQQSIYYLLWFSKMSIIRNDQECICPLLELLNEPWQLSYDSLKETESRQAHKTLPGGTHVSSGSKLVRVVKERDEFGNQVQRLLPVILGVQKAEAGEQSANDLSWLLKKYKTSLGNLARLFFSLEYK